MTDEPNNLVLEMLRNIRQEMAEMRAETNLKIETLAGSMVSMRKDMNEMKAAIDSLRLDVRMIAIAVDGHAQRLDKMEATLGSLKH